MTPTMPIEKLCGVLARIDDPNVIRILLEHWYQAPEPEPVSEPVQTELLGHYQSRPKRQVVEARRSKRKWDHREFSMLRTYAREDRDLEEICAQLGRSPQAVLTKLRRAMPDLYQNYKHHDTTRPR